MSGRHYFMEQIYGQLHNHYCSAVTNIMDGNNYERGSIEEDWSRKRNSETIQDEEITICLKSYKA